MVGGRSVSAAYDLGLCGCEAGVDFGLGRELGLQARLYAHLLAAARRALRHTSHPRAAPTQMLTAVVHRADDEPIRSMMRG